MGSKMAAASRVVQAVKPHAQLIKFPERKTSPRPNGARAPRMLNMSSLSKTQETPDTSDLVRTLPQKYRRKAMSIEEMDYIQRGGPE
uniref:28S ribosomal protein S36, mitochondrial isoform X3 n=1 Tax=Geotrypetes seraphini TaxID=260995 RepID=A0A6P8PUB8_GEOSA|nr:28S ribosomal protein S36, mitochondrial isoform X3 [Geotrypetes seraphini]